MKVYFIKFMDLSSIQKKKVFKTTKASHIKKSTILIISKTNTAPREQDNEKLKDTCIYNLSRRLLTNIEKSLFQEGPEFTA